MRLDKFRLCNGQVLVQHLGQFIGQSRSDGLRFSRVDRDGERPTVSIVAIDRPISFPDAIGVTGRMISVADEKNLHPEIGLQLVLRFDRREIITGGNDTTVENDEIVFARDENDLLRLTRSERKSGDETQRNQERQMEKSTLIYVGLMVVIAFPLRSWEALLFNFGPQHLRCLNFGTDGAREERLEGNHDVVFSRHFEQGQTKRRYHVAIGTILPDCSRDSWTAAAHAKGRLFYQPQNS